MTRAILFSNFSDQQALLDANPQGRFHNSRMQPGRNVQFSRTFFAAAVGMAAVSGAVFQQCMIQNRPGLLQKSRTVQVSLHINRAVQNPRYGAV